MSSVKAKVSNLTDDCLSRPDESHKLDGWLDTRQILKKVSFVSHTHVYAKIAVAD